MISPSEVKSLVEANRGMAYRAAYRARISTGTRLDLDELAAEGLLGLVQAATRYRPELGAWFPSYASRRVKGQIYDRIRADRDWTLDELPDDYREEADTRPRPDELAEAEDRKREVRAAVSRLPAAEREVITAYHLDGRKLREIAEERGVDDTRISQIKRAGLARLRVKLASPTAR